jgi:hypothetical protein
MSSLTQFGKAVLIVLACFGGFMLLIVGVGVVHRMQPLPSPARQVKPTEPPPPWVQRMAGVPEDRIVYPSDE